jgi:hypothetical protein
MQVEQLIKANTEAEQLFPRLVHAQIKTEVHLSWKEQYLSNAWCCLVAVMLRRCGCAS